MQLKEFVKEKRRLANPTQPGLVEMMLSGIIPFGITIPNDQRN